MKYSQKARWICVCLPSVQICVLISVLSEVLRVRLQKCTEWLINNLRGRFKCFWDMNLFTAGQWVFACSPARTHFILLAYYSSCGLNTHTTACKGSGLQGRHDKQLVCFSPYFLLALTYSPLPFPAEKSVYCGVDRVLWRQKQLSDVCEHESNFKISVTEQESNTCIKFWILQQMLTNGSGENNLCQTNLKCW